MGIVSDESTGVRAGLHRRGEPPRPGGQGTGAEREEAARVDDPGKPGKAEELRPGPAGGVPLEGGGRRPPPPAAPRPGLPGHGGPHGGRGPSCSAGLSWRGRPGSPRSTAPTAASRRRGYGSGTTRSPRGSKKRAAAEASCAYAGNPPVAIPSARPRRTIPKSLSQIRIASAGTEAGKTWGQGLRWTAALRLPRRTIAPARTPPRTRCRHPCRPAP